MELFAKQIGTSRDFVLMAKNSEGLEKEIKILREDSLREWKDFISNWEVIEGFLEKKNVGVDSVTVEAFAKRKAESDFLNSLGI